MERPSDVTNRSRPQVPVAIGDCGIGVKHSLIKNEAHLHLSNKADKVAIVEAFKPSVSSKSEGGTGLTNIEQAVLELNGSLFFASNTGYLRVVGGKRYIGDRNFNFPGVQLQIGFPTRGNI